MPKTIIATQLAIDPPVSMDANYKFDRVDRRYIDDQIRAVEQHLVDNLISGKHASWYDLSGDSDEVIAGDTVCLAGVSSLVTKCSVSALAGASSVLGVVIQSASPGGKVLVAIGGVVPASITGLGSTSGFAKANTTTSRCERIDELSSGDFGIGTVDGAGNLHVIPAINASSSAAIDVGTDIDKHAGTVDTVKGFRQIPLVGSNAAVPRVGGTWQYNEQGTHGFKLAKPVVFHANDYGCIGDGTTDDTAALEALFEAASQAPPSTPARGTEQRIIVFPNDAVYKCTSPITIYLRQGLVVRGPAKIHYTGTATGDAGAFFNILSSADLTFEDLHFTYENPAFAGYIVGTQYGLVAGDNSTLVWNRCKFYGTDDFVGHHGAAACLSLKRAIDVSIRDCEFTAALIGIDGHSDRMGDAGFANTVLVEACSFHKLGNGLPRYGTPNECAGIKNPGEAWVVINSTFEPLQGFVSALGTPTLTFAAAGRTITRDTGSFVDEGWGPGYRLTSAGTVSNNFSGALIDSVSALTITLTSQALVDETFVNVDTETLVSTQANEVSANAVWQESDYFAFGFNFIGNWVGDGPGEGPLLNGLKVLGGQITGNLLSAQGGQNGSIRLEGSNGVVISGNRMADIVFAQDGLGHNNAGVIICGNSGSLAYINKDSYGGFPWIFGNEDTSGFTGQIPFPVSLGDRGAVYTRLVLADATWDPGSVPAGGYASSPTLTFSQCKLGQVFSIGCSPAPPNGVLVTGAIILDGCVHVTVFNFSGAAWAPGALALKFHGVW